ncbi:MAG: cupredoxin domain-containing protein [Candidatus Levybacteria bacterium]|nr:cupredoxin domain-containing protein [Candidatus Levybacteria bacterium]
MNKLFIGIVALVIIFAGLFFYKNLKNNTSPVSGSTASSVQQTQTNKPLSVVMVTITKDGFSPKTIAVKKNTEVIWVNKDGSRATVNSAVHPTHLVYPPLNLGQVQKNSTVQLVFDKPGTYNYHNHFIPSQTGTVKVE